jgi:hypothetical protein
MYLFRKRSHFNTVRNCYSLQNPPQADTFEAMRSSVMSLAPYKTAQRHNQIAIDIIYRYRMEEKRNEINSIQYSSGNMSWKCKLNSCEVLFI